MYFTIRIITYKYFPHQNYAASQIVFTYNLRHFFYQKNIYNQRQNYKNSSNSIRLFRSVSILFYSNCLFLFNNRLKKI